MSSDQLAIGQALYLRARQLIPGGTQLLSKRPELLLPEQWPAYYETAKGVRTTDLDGRVYTDMTGCGIGSTILGYADDDVNAAVIDAINRGSMATLNPPEEVELAELLIELHPWADMVRFCRAGGEAMSIAVRIARASTGRDEIAFCGYHGWHDWYLSANLNPDGHDPLGAHLLAGLDPAGVPKGLAGLLHPFNYNALDELEAVAKKRSDRIAAVVMEPVRGSEPEPGFLEGVRALCDRIGAVLIFDEITTGFRKTTGGVHLTLSVKPDIAVFAKAMANGFPMSAIIGIRNIMEAAQSTFISSTAWTERVGPVAALATIRKHRDRNVAHHICNIGDAVKAAWQKAADSAGLEISVSGLPSLAHFSFDYEDAQLMRSLYTQCMLERGFMAIAVCYPMYAHTDEDVAGFAGAAEKSFAIVAEAHDTGQLRAMLKGPVAHSGFARLTD